MAQSRFVMRAFARPSRALAQKVQLQRSFTASARGWQKRYSEDHEWIDTTNSESARFGITNFAAKALGDVVYVELPTVGSEVSKGDTIAAVESVKSASDIMTPASGTILEVNEELDNNPALINSGAEGEGWIASIKTSSTAEWEDLMDAEAYRKYTEELDSHD